VRAQDVLPVHALGLRAWRFTVPCILGKWETILPGWRALHPARESRRGPCGMDLVAATLPWLLCIGHPEYPSHSLLF